MVVYGGVQATALQQVNVYNLLAAVNYKRKCLGHHQALAEHTST
jgi:hypothetical protein